MTEIGWVALYRKIQDDRFWLDEKFTKGQAWVDLLLLAGFEDKRIMVRGIEVPIKRGSLFWSEVSLAKRWQWSREKVRTYIKNLINNGEIERKVDNRIGVISILNYEKYQSKVDNRPDNKPDNKPDPNKQSNKVTRNAPKKEVVKKPKKTDGFLSGKLPPLENKYIYQICDELFVMPEDVKQVDTSLRLEVEAGNGEKYRITNQVLGVKRWVLHKLDDGKFQKRNEDENASYQRMRMQVFPEPSTNSGLPDYLL